MVNELQHTYLISVDRDGIRRTALYRGVYALDVLRHAIQAGFPVYCHAASPQEIQDFNAHHVEVLEEPISVKE